MQLTRYPFAGLLLVLCLAPAHAQHAALTAFYAEVDSLSAEFEQVQVDENGDVLQSASGVFLLERPDKFRWEYREPYRQVLVSDGRAFRLYDVDLAQVTVRDIGDTLRATPAQLLAGGTGLDQAFTVESLSRDDGLAWARLTPRTDEGDFREIRIGLQDKRPLRLELDDQLGQTTRIDFDGVRVNHGVDDDRFRLDLPDDVEVVNARGGAPPP
jgi:outer membrane lipoprotein carrier protein